jgi:2-haloacid dehalogenase
MLAAAVEAARIRATSRGALGRRDPHLLPRPVYEPYRHSSCARGVVFVSSNRWDVMGAAAFGFRTVWVNRAKMPEEYGTPPNAMLTDLNGLMTMTG